MRLKQPGLHIRHRHILDELLKLRPWEYVETGTKSKKHETVGESQNKTSSFPLFSCRGWAHTQSSIRGVEEDEEKDERNDAKRPHVGTHKEFPGCGNQRELQAIGSGTH